MGKGSKPTIGFWYHVAYHHGLTIGPIDAFLEYRGGDKTAWQGELTASGTINVNAPNLWGGEKDQGGIVGNLDVMFGEPTQVPNPYLVSTFGNQTAAWRGFSTVAFTGGRYGAMNPYPQKPSYKIRQIINGWDDGCWYPEKAQIGLVTDPVVTNAWVHVALVCDGTTVFLFVRGQLKGTATLDYTPNGGSGGYTTVGRYRFTNPGVEYDGLVDRFRVTKAVRWSGGFDSTRLDYGSDDAFKDSVIIDLPMDGANNSTVFTDSKGNTWTTSTTGAKITTDDSVAGGASGEFSGGFISTPYAGGLNLGAHFTIDCWIKPGSLGGNIFTINQLDSIHAGYGLRALSSGAVQAVFGRNTWPADPVTIDETPDFQSSLRGINPAHVLYYARTNAEMGRESPASINTASLTAAADKLFAEGFGICPKWDPASETVEDFEKRICKLIGGSFSRSLEDGQWYLDLARGDYVLDDLPILTDDDILDFKEQPTLLDNAINSVSVRYFDPEKKETIVTAPVRALGLVSTFGTIHQTNEYLEIPTGDLAARVAERDMLTTATPTRAFDLVTSRKPYNWRPNQYYRLQAPKRGIADMVCIVGDKQTGTLKSGAIRLKSTQDIYGLPSTSFVQVEPGVDTTPSQIPTVIPLQRVFEAPYVEVAGALSRADLAALPADVGYAMAAASTAATDIDFTMMVSASGSDYVELARGDWCAVATIIEAAAPGDLAFTLANASRLAAVAVGMAALWDDEIVRVDAIDAGALTLTLGRGCADTVSAETHAAGGRVWFYDSGVAKGATEYTDAEVIAVKLLSNTGSRRLPLDSATALSLTFSSRQYRPYPPGQFRVNGIVAPTEIVGAVTVTGVHRDRVQQADQLVDSEMAAIGPEAGTTYTVRYYISGTLVHTDSGLTTPSSTYTPTAGGIMRVEMESVRDSLTSYQMHVREFAVGAVLQAEDGSLITTEAVQSILMG